MQKSFNDIQEQIRRITVMWEELYGGSRVVNPSHPAWSVWYFKKLGFRVRNARRMSYFQPDKNKKYPLKNN